MVVQPRTDWLQRAARVQMCPLCLVASEYEADYLDALCDRLATDAGDVVSGAALDDLCADHMRGFEETAQEARLDLRTIFSAHLRRLDGLSSQLSELDPEGWLTMRECGLCLGRNELALLCATRVLTGLAHPDNPNAPHLEYAGGLCATHFLMCWETTSAAADREALCAIQLTVVQRLSDIARSDMTRGDIDHRKLRTLVMRATTIASM